MFQTLLIYSFLLLFITVKASTPIIFLYHHDLMMSNYAIIERKTEKRIEIYDFRFNDYINSRAIFTVYRS